MVLFVVWNLMVLIGIQAINGGSGLKSPEVGID